MSLSVYHRLAAGLRFRFFTSRWLGQHAEAILTVLIAVSGTALASFTILILKVQDGDISGSRVLPALLTADALYALLLLGLITNRIITLLAARRREYSGAATLHLRFIGAFSLSAVAPALFVAVFATLTINFGFDEWFNESVGRIVDNSVTTANAYVQEHQHRLQATSQATATAVELADNRRQLIEPVLFRESQSRGLKRAYLIDPQGEILVRGYNSFPIQLLPTRSGDPASCLRGRADFHSRWHAWRVAFCASADRERQLSLYGSRCEFDRHAACRAHPKNGGPLPAD